MTLDAEKIIEFPDFKTWAGLYAKFKDPLVKSLNSSYSLADREDAVEEAFHKLMHKKDREAYGEKVPRSGDHRGDVRPPLRCVCGRTPGRRP